MLHGRVRLSVADFAVSVKNTAAESELMRSFTLLHLSDLHFNGKNPKAADVLLESIRQEISKTEVPRFAILTGDLVESPSSKAISASKDFIAKLEAQKLFAGILVIPGNHDVKKFYGSFSKSQRFNREVSLPHEIFDSTCGLHVMGVDSTSAAFARGGISKAEYDKLILQYYRSEEANGTLRPDGFGIIKVAAVHHHPLPLALGEGHKILGIVKDENLMYLESPARFLQACLECGVALVLHGHRHVEGLARYSIPTAKTLASNSLLGTSHDDSWQTLYVLSCPSSTGAGCDAGYNILEFEFSSEAAFADVSRLKRLHNQGVFKRIDSGRLDSKLRIIFSRQIVPDTAVIAEARLEAMEPNPPEHALFDVISTMFRRRAFMSGPEKHWGQLLYATMKTRLIWQKLVIPKLRLARKKMGSEVLLTLTELEDFVAFDVLELGKPEPDNLKHLLNDKTTFLRELPVSHIDIHRERPLEKRRTLLLDKLRGQLASSGVSTSGFGKAAEMDFGE